MFKKTYQYLFGSRLRNKFITIFILLSGVPVLVLGGVSLYLLDLSHRRDVSNLELQAIDQKSEEVKKFFAGTMGVLQLQVATDKTYIDQADKVFILDGILAENKVFEEVSFIDLRGRETEKRRSVEKSELELEDVSALPKFGAPKEGKNFVGEVYYALSGPYVTLSAPVKNKNGEIIQVLSAEVNLSALSRSIETARVGASGYLILIDGAGYAMSSKIGSDLSSTGRIKRVLGGAILDGLDPRDIYKSILNKTTVVGAAKKIPQLGWAILVEWPLDDADAILKDLRNQVFNLTLFAVLTVFFLAPLFAARLLKPIHALEAGAHDIEEGNFEKQVDIKTSDELEDLGGAFNKMAKGLRRLQELKNEFVFIAAHELRTPVTAIKGYVSMALEAIGGGAVANIRQYLETVEKANERLIGLVNDILEIARSEAGRIQIEVFSVDIRLLVEETAFELKPLADQKKISINYDKPKNLLLALTDTARFKEIITNLVSNAIKYNNDGGWIKIYHEIQPDFVVTHVEDNGFGMSEEDKKHMFEKFFRAEEGKIKSIIGTGLGMFITKELVEKMGGKIWFESAVGKGTKFSFSLPKSQTS